MSESGGYAGAVSSVQAIPVEEFIARLPAWQQELASHVLLGGFNERGKPVGFHHAPGGVAPPGRRIDRVIKRFPDGSYQAEVSLWDPRRGWVSKPGRHSLFPDHWSAEQVIAAGLQAYRGRRDEQGRRWLSRVRDMPIKGYRRSGGRGPATFFPDLDR